MAARSDITAELNRLANGGATYRTPDVAVADALAANQWAGTSGLDVVGALNVKAATSGLDLQGAANALAGTTGLGTLEALSRVTS